MCANFDNLGKPERVHFKTLTSVAIKTVAVAAASVAFAVSAQAAPQLVDFTDGSKWSAANGLSSFTASYGDVDVTASSVGGNLSFNGGRDKNGCISGLNQNVHDLICDGDGLGIGNDEITQGGFQQITITFSTSVTLNDIEFLDLFNNSNESEEALVRLNNGLFETHTSSNLTGGYHRTLETGPDITMVVLKSANDNHSDYALARISFTLNNIQGFTTGVPAPSALLLMMPGLALIARRRRHKGETLPTSRWFWKRPEYLRWA